MKETTITILCENMVGRRGSGEHGFAALVERDGNSYLFDTGGGKFIVDNAITFGKRLEDMAGIILSHGHDDHVGGLRKVLERTGTVPVYGHPDIFVDRYLMKETAQGTEFVYKGIPFKTEFLESLGARFVLNREFVEIADDMYLTGEVPRLTDFEKLDANQKRKVGDEWRIESFPDDQSLILKTGRGLVIVFGCAHAGMINIVRHAVAKTGETRIRGIIGGTHLAFLDDARREASIAELKKMSLDFVGVSHCTGIIAASRLAQEFGDRFIYGQVGTVFTV